VARLRNKCGNSAHLTDPFAVDQFDGGLRKTEVIAYRFAAFAAFGAHEVEVAVSI
jgi:hypothetical protein